MEEVFKIYKVTCCNRWGTREYQISNFGRCKINGELIQLKSDRGGYVKIGGYIKLHRAVAELFIPNPENKPEVDHIDGNPSNNHVTNLRWVTHKENMNNPVCKQRMSKSSKGKPSNVKGKTWSKKSRERFSKIKTGTKLSEDTKKKMSTAHQRLRHTEETKAKMRKPKNITHTKEWLEWNKTRYKGKTWKLINGKRVWMDKEA